MTYSNGIKMIFFTEWQYHRWPWICSVCRGVTISSLLPRSLPITSFKRKEHDICHQQSRNRLLGIFYRCYLPM